MSIDIRRQIKEYLSEKYNKAALSKKECAGEIGISVSTIDTYISKNDGMPNYIKLGSSKNARIIFPIEEVAKFLSQTIEVDSSSTHQQIEQVSEPYYSTVDHHFKKEWS